MGAGHPSEADCRRAVRGVLPKGASGQLVLAAVSGGADSLALAYALAREAPAADLRAGAVVVDHGLQDGSAEAAERAAEQCRNLGLEPVQVRPVTVPTCGDGVEAAARAARYAALDQAVADTGAVMVLLGHTRQDQAEQVLLGLVRGSGARSMAGMPRARGVYRRPLLDLPRSRTRELCEAVGLTPWEDPANDDRAYMRVRVRQALAHLEADLGPGLTEGLARSADLLRADANHLDELAEQAVRDLTGLVLPGRAALDVPPFAALPDAIRGRVWRRVLLLVGAPAGRLTATHVAECDRLLTDWRGQGPLDLPGPTQVARRGGRVHLHHGLP